MISKVYILNVVKGGCCKVDSEFIKEELCSKIFSIHFFSFFGFKSSSVSEIATYGIKLRNITNYGQSILDKLLSFSSDNFFVCWVTSCVKLSVEEAVIFTDRWQKSLFFVSDSTLQPIWTLHLFMKISCVNEWRLPNHAVRLTKMRQLCGLPAEKKRNNEIIKFVSKDLNHVSI